MNGKLIAMVLGVTLVLATATVYTQSAFATANPCSQIVGPHNPNCTPSTDGGFTFSRGFAFGHSFGGG